MNQIERSKLQWAVDITSGIGASEKQQTNFGSLLIFIVIKACRASSVILGLASPLASLCGWRFGFVDSNVVNRPIFANFLPPIGSTEPKRLNSLLYVRNTALTAKLVGHENGAFLAHSSHPLVGSMSPDRPHAIDAVPSHLVNWPRPMTMTAIAPFPVLAYYCISLTSMYTSRKNNSLSWDHVL